MRPSRDLERKHRMTRQRQVILEIVKSGRHLTADEVYEKVRKRLPSVSMGTVYRNLDALAALGHITKLHPDRLQMSFDGNTEEHYHITCMRCLRIEDAPFKIGDDRLGNLENALGNLTKYGIFGHKLEFVGLCRECMGREEDFLSDLQTNTIGKEAVENGDQRKSDREECVDIICR